MTSLLPPHLADAPSLVADPSAPPERLQGLFAQLYHLGLGRSSDALFDETRRLIGQLAQNPNTPLITLAAIAPISYPAARSVARNPGFALALLVDPLCGESLTLQVVQAVVQRWPSDDEMAASLEPMLERALTDEALATRVDSAIGFRFTATYRRKRGGRWPVRDALMDHFDAALGNPELKERCFLGYPRQVPAARILEAEASVESRMAARLGLRFTRWFEGLVP